MSKYHGHFFYSAGFLSLRRPLRQGWQVTPELAAQADFLKMFLEMI